MREFFARFAVHAFVEPEGVVAVPLGPLVEAVPDAETPGLWRARYVGARRLRWHEPLFARIVVSRWWCGAGEMLPPWYYALGYFDPARGARGEAVFFFLPIALLVRALRWAEFLWNRIRSRPSFDRQLQEAVECELERRAFVTHASVGFEHGTLGSYAWFCLMLADGRVFYSEDGESWRQGTAPSDEEGWIAISEIARRADG